MQPTGYTAQYIIIAMALRIQLVEYFGRAELIAKRFDIDSNEELEARRLTIVLLTASLCESCINVALAVTLPPDEFQALECKPTLQKWLKYANRVNPNFVLDPASPPAKELKFIFDCRNAITHAKPEVFSEAGPIHRGNHGPWSDLLHARVLPIARTPVELLIPFCDRAPPLVATMSSSVQRQLRLADFQRHIASRNNP